MIPTLFPVTHQSDEVAQKMNSTALITAAEYAKAPGEKKGMLRVSMMGEAWRAQQLGMPAARSSVSL